MNLKIGEAGLSFDDVLIKPQKSIVSSRKEVDTSSLISKDYKISMPILSSNMKTVTNVDTVLKMYKMGANGVLHRFGSHEERVAEVMALKDYAVKPIITSVGTKDDIQLLRSLAEASHVLLLDVAHAHSEHIMEFVREVLLPLKSNYPNLNIVVGNVATAEATREYCEMGVDGLKVGIGPGATCTTRMQTGVGVPQISCLLECYEVAKEFGVPLISDGGVRYPSDIAKAIVAGASTVMIGKELAFTLDNTASDVDDFTNEIYNFSASLGSQKKILKKYYGNASFQNNRTSYVEGAEISQSFNISELPTIEGKLLMYSQGLQSMVSYAGGKNLVDVIGKTDILRTSSVTTMQESGVRR
jgi:IMP dehydrogenase